MKHLYIFFIFTSYWLSATAQESVIDSAVLKKVTAVAIYDLPCSSYDPIYSMYVSSLRPNEFLPNSSRFVYFDWERTKKFHIPYPTPSGIYGCRLMKRFQSRDKQKNIILTLISISDYARFLLVNFDRESLSILDTLEVSTQISQLRNKEFFIDTAMNIEVRDMEIMESAPKPFKIGGENHDFKARRVDRHYRIGDNGKFILVREQRYKPRVYTKEFLDNHKGNSLFTGDEEPE